MRHCKCGNDLTLKSNGKYNRYCSSECHPGFGKKRPGHSEALKKQAREGTNSSLFKKGRRNNYVNSIPWKRKVLDNKGILHHHMDDTQLYDFFNTFKQTLAHSIKAKRNFIVTMYNKYCDSYNLCEYIDINKINDYTDEQIKKITKQLNALKTIEFNKNGKGIAKRFKRIRMDGFKYNLSSRISLTTRSSYEANYINYFEKNKIWWDYEVLTIKTHDSYVLPDFVFYYADKKYILEVKGFLLDEQFYFSEKMKYVHQYALDNDYITLFTYNEFPLSIENLIKQRIDFKC